MALKYYEASFASVLPKLRSAEIIKSELNKFRANGFADDSKARVAEIELKIREGNDLLRLQEYGLALDKFKEARALIYKLLLPAFDVIYYVLSKDYQLPHSRQIEQKFLETTVQLNEIIRPTVPSIGPVIGIDPGDPPDTVRKFLSIGYQEVVSHEELAQSATVNGVLLMQQNKPGAAVQLMEYALKRINAVATKQDPSMRAALELNIANAYFQLNNPTKAREFSNQAFVHFGEANDPIGEAQALYTVGLSERKRGKEREAKKLLSRASDILKDPSKFEHSFGLGNFPIAGIERTERDPVAPGDISGTPLKLTGDISNSSRSFALSNDQLFVIDTSRDTKVLNHILKEETTQLTFRIPGRSESWGSIPIQDEKLTIQQNKNWQVGVPVGNEVVIFPSGVYSKLNTVQIEDNVYKIRQSATNFAALDWKLVDTASTNYYLTHLYSYVLCVKIGDCYHELGQFEKSEQYYLQAADYSYLNKSIEGTILWVKLAENALQWGHRLYKDEKIEEAKMQYAKIILPEGGGVPVDSILYKNNALQVPTGIASEFIAKINQSPLPDINPDIAFAILTANYFLIQIENGLDYYGLLLSPIHTFEYLQSVAKGFAQQAIQAEREFVNFKSREELESATRRDLETTVAMAEAEKEIQYEQWKASTEDKEAATAAEQLAQERRNNAIAQRNRYSSVSATQIWAQAASQALLGGEDGMWGEINELADQLNRGETISGPGPKLAAAQTLLAGRKTREYELQKMQDNIDELGIANTIAQNQRQAAERRERASQIAFEASQKREQLANEALNAFDDEFFTPDTWAKMASIMRNIARSYLHQAIRIAKLMERAYNFENDTDYKIIKNEYGFAIGNTSNNNNALLLGGDNLLQDIDAFTYYAITTKTRKNSRIKDIISISSDFPAQFEEFRQTGLLSIETDLYEFDRLHPGFYSQRLEAVEVEIVGVIPSVGLNGILRMGGVTKYRKADGTDGKRVHQVDTMAMSDFVLRNDIFLYSSETGVRGLFQGFGIGSTVQLYLPRRSNDFDYRRVFDINLALYYTAKFDRPLQDKILAKPPKNGELSLLRNFGLRYDFPDAWYAFYRAGAATFNLDRFRLPFNQQNFSIRTIYFHVITQPGISNQGIELRVTGPDGTVGQAFTNENGVSSSEFPTLDGLEGKDPIGAWTIEVRGGSSLLEDDALQYSRVYNIQFGLEYSFEYVPETI